MGRLLRVSGRNGGIAYPEAEKDSYLPRAPGARRPGREGADSGNPESLRPGDRDPLGGRAFPAGTFRSIALKKRMNFAISCRSMGESIE